MATALLLGIFVCANAEPAGGLLGEIRPGYHNKQLDVTPDASAIAYALSPDGQGHTCVWVKELPAGIALRLPGCMPQNAAEGVLTVLMRPTWSPDGGKLAYLGQAGDEIRLHIWDRHRGGSRSFDSRAACSQAQYCRSYDLQWSADAQTVYYLAENERSRSRRSNIDEKAGNASLIEQRRLTFEDPGHGGVTVRESSASAASNTDNGNRVASRVDVVAAKAADGKVRTLLSGPGIHKIFLSPDGKKLLVMASAGREPLIRQMYADFYLLDRLHATNTEAASPALVKVKQFIGRGVWSPDSRFFAFAEHGALANGDLFLLDTVSRKARNLTAALKLPPQPEDSFASDPESIANRTYAYRGKFGHVDNSPVWSGDGSTLFAARSGSVGLELWKISAANGKALRLTDSARLPVLQVLSRKGAVVRGKTAHSLIVSVRFSELESGFASIDSRTGATLELARVRGRLPANGANESLLSVAGNVPLAIFAHETAKTPQEIFAIDFAGGKLGPLTEYNRGYVQGDFGERRRLSWLRPDGERREGTLHQPPIHARPGGRSPPVIVLIYPHSVVREIDFNRFESRTDLYPEPLPEMLQSGYAILEPAIGVKTGGGACEDVVGDVVQALDAADATNSVDASKAALFGISFGGWAVNCVITRTDRFKAAISVAGVADMFSISFNPLSSNWGIGGGQTRIGKPIGEVPQLYYTESPVFAAANVNTPLLLAHGKADGIVPVDQSVEMYTSLASLGKTVTLATYDGRGHRDLLEHPDYQRRVKEWIELYLR